MGCHSRGSASVTRDSSIATAVARHNRTVSERPPPSSVTIAVWYGTSAANRSGADQITVSV
jgi:hypothetical protein